MRRAGSSEDVRGGPPWRGGAWLAALVQNDSSRWPAGKTCLSRTLVVRACVKWGGGGTINRSYIVGHIFG